MTETYKNLTEPFIFQIGENNIPITIRIDKVFNDYKRQTEVYRAELNYPVCGLAEVSFINSLGDILRKRTQNIYRDNEGTHFIDVVGNKYRLDDVDYPIDGGHHPYFYTVNNIFSR